MLLKTNFTQESREEVVRSILNQSHSKQLWTFPKKNRFDKVKTECPVAFYQPQVSTLSSKKSAFAISKRKIFTQINDAPPPGTYHPEPQISIRGASFGESREKCAFRCYLSRDMEKPGPTQYESSPQKKSKGFTLRPKTANQRNYFIDDKEQQQVPSPFEYCVNIENQGKMVSSKFKSTVLGRSGLRRTQPRFKFFQDKTPGPSFYRPKSMSLRRQSTGGSIGNSARNSFIDCVRKLSYQPGPGNYELPSQFGHYKKIERSTSQNKLGHL